MLRCPVSFLCAATVNTLQRDGLFRTCGDAEPTPLAALREGRMSLLATVRPQPQPSRPTQATLILRGERMNGEHAIRANVHTGAFILTALPVDDRDHLAGPEGAFLGYCHTDSTAG